VHICARQFLSPESVKQPSCSATKSYRRLRIRPSVYFITFTDDAIHLLAAKSDAFSAYRQFEAWARAQDHCAAIKVLCWIAGTST
jgi:hypothetical protein